MNSKLSVIIPVYKKTDMFLSNLSHNIPLLPKNAEIIIVDDASQEYLNEKLEPFLKKRSVELIENQKNLGFSGAINKGIKASHGAHILLLNSDVRLIQKFPEDFEKFFSEDSHVAAVAFPERNDNKLLGKSIISFTRGLVTHTRAKDREKGLTAWASGGSCLFRADRLNELNGFDEMYSPFYWEDIDLSFRAYSRGWLVVFDPKYPVEHARESTINTFYSSVKVKHIAHRNQFIFTWANITDFDLFIKHITWLPYHLLVMSIKGETQFISGFLSALQYIPTILKRRSVKLQHQKVSDKEVFSLFV